MTAEEAARLRISSAFLTSLYWNEDWHEEWYGGRSPLPGGNRLFA